MLGGYVGKILRVDLSHASFQEQPLDQELVYNFIGGRGYAAKILYDEIAEGVDPLGDANKLIFMTGPLTGTTFPGAGRLAVSSKSPLTGTIADSSMGGSFATYLKRAGFDGIIFLKKSSKPVYLLIDDGKASIHNASGIWGKDTVESRKILLEKYPDAWVAVIGPAGENLSRIACIISSGKAGRDGTAGRCGMGAVMGSKKLKAIVVKGNRRFEVADGEGFKKLISKVRKIIETHPITGTDGGLGRFGTGLLVHRTTAAGMLPVDNFSNRGLTFEQVDPFSGETVKEKYLTRRTACFACPTACGRWVKVGNWEGKGPEFENTTMLGPNSGFFDYPNEIVPLNRLCDELGMDSISMGVVLGFARANGKVKDIKEAFDLVREAASGSSIFSHGVKFAAEKLGSNVIAAHSRGLELPAYDPRGAKGIALAYATSNRGGCHLRAYTIAPEVNSSPEFVDPSTEVGKADLVIRMQDSYAVWDSIVACKFHSFALFGTLNFELEDIAKLLTALTGLEFSEKHLHEVGSRIYNLERMFNVHEGLGPEEDNLPAQFGIDLSNLKRDYYQNRGWGKSGKPKKLAPLKKPKAAKKVEVTLSPLEKIEMPQLQVALDMDADIQTIAKVAKDVYEGGARIVEAGTPSVKRHGVDKLLPALQKAAPEALIVADLKTMDVGNLEARIAFRAGADVSAVLAIGGRTKIIEAVSEAAKWDKAVLIDLIDTPDPIALIDSLRKDLVGQEQRVIFCLHRGISEQLKGRGIYEQTQLIAEAKKHAAQFRLAVAGGIKEGVAKDVAKAGADICIAGSAIYNSANPKEKAARILKEIKDAVGSG